MQQILSAQCKEKRLQINDYTQYGQILSFQKAKGNKTYALINDAWYPCKELEYRTEEDLAQDHYESIQWQGEELRFYDCNSILPSAQGFYYKRKTENQTSRERTHKIVSTFDIETTSTTTTINGEEVHISFLYHWQWNIGGKNFRGRYWNEFLKLYHRVVKYYQLSPYTILVIYVHNLPFEHEFLKSFLKYDTKHTWANDKNKVVKCRTVEGVEWRCSYMLTNMSLSKACQNTANVIHGKVDGALDYRKIRHSSTKLSRREFAYNYMDTQGLYEVITEKLREETNGYYSIPMTSTGYVRRELRNEIAKYPDYIETVRKMEPSLELYETMVEMFRGGNTHANRFYSKKLQSHVHSIDIASSYPFQIMTKYFPMSAFYKETNLEDKEYVNWLLKNKCCILKLKIEGVYLKPGVPIPYLSTSKCKKIPTSKKNIYDNGRIINCQYLETTMTEIDFEIFRSQYNFKSIEITDLWSAKRGLLPEPIRNVTYKFFCQKTQLKDLEGFEYEYLKSKNLLNAIFGAMVTNTLKDGYTLDENGEYVERIIQNKQKELSKTYHKGFLCYQWGCYITSHARKQLQEMIDLIGISDVLYVDTDSVKYLHPEKHQEAVDAYNAKLLETYKDYQISATNKKGKLITLGLYEDDGTYETFLTYGAKKYAYTYQLKDEQKQPIPNAYSVKLTVAGANKSSGSQYLLYHMLPENSRIQYEKDYKRGKLKATLMQNETKNLDKVFQIGMILSEEESGRTVAYRHENYNMDYEVTDYLGKKEIVTIHSGLSVTETTYTLGLSNDYERLLNFFDIELYD